MGNWFRMGAGSPWSPRRPPSPTVSTPARSSSEAAHGLMRTELSAGQQEMQVARYLDPIWAPCLQLGLYFLEFLINQLLPYRDHGEQERIRPKVMISEDREQLQQRGA